MIEPIGMNYSEAQLDGRACIGCGQDGVLSPVEWVGALQLLAHDECQERDLDDDEKTRYTRRIVSELERAALLVDVTPGPGFAEEIQAVVDALSDRRHYVRDSMFGCIVPVQPGDSAAAVAAQLHAEYQRRVEAGEIEIQKSQAVEGVPLDSDKDVTWDNMHPNLQSIVINSLSERACRLAQRCAEDDVRDLLTVSAVNQAIQADPFMGHALAQGMGVGFSAVTHSNRIVLKAFEGAIKKLSE